MVVSRFIRNPFSPPTSPPTAITGFFVFPTISATFDADIFLLFNADVVGTLQNFNRFFVYQVTWSYSLDLVGSFPTNLSSFAGRPERRNAGVLTYLHNGYAQRWKNINYEKETDICGKFLYSNTQGRLVNNADVGASPAINLTWNATIVGTNEATLINFLSPGQYNFVDQLSIFLYSGITYSLKVAYHAATILDIDPSVAARISAI